MPVTAFSLQANDTYRLKSMISVGYQIEGFQQFVSSRQPGSNRGTLLGALSSRPRNGLGKVNRDLREANFLATSLTD